ncbi:TerD family protein [Streptomyces marincola]|uniref:TerD family protein n=1 Tax=Streptomyces marincola TaxID=2878388 RepID=UPI001CF3F11E|nr:TerD family protein [Streptomyces marincola]UCM87659.1 TerD family protein [Streptomyces marincola]
MTHGPAKGSTIHLPVTALRAVLRWKPTARATGRFLPDLDLSVLLLGSGGLVRSEGDLVFYNQPRHPSGRVRRLPKRQDGEGLRDAVEAELARLEPGVARLVLAASADGGFGALASPPRLLLHDAAGGAPLVALPLAPRAGDRALVCGEVLRTAGGWAFRALGDGYAGGLVALAAAFGVRAAPAPRPDPRAPHAYGYPQPDPAFTLPPQGPQFLPRNGADGG